MIPIQAEGTNFVYVPRVMNELALSSPLVDYRRFDKEIAKRILQTNNIRLTFFQAFPKPRLLWPYYLTWNRSMDLDALDAKVEHGDVCDEDFEWSIKTHYQVTHCFTCGASFETLGIDAADSYPNAPLLLENKLRKMKLHTCPTCGYSLRQHIIKIIAQVADA